MPLPKLSIEERREMLFKIVRDVLAMPDEDEPAGTPSEEKVEPDEEPKDDAS